jgi:hypothetical protein
MDMGRTSWVGGWDDIFMQGRDGLVSVGDEEGATGRRDGEEGMILKMVCG